MHFLLQLFLVSLLIVLPIHGFATANNPFLPATKDSVMDDYFLQKEGFAGGDGIYSIPLNNQRVLWLFGDTFVGKIDKTGKRRACAFIHNSVSITDDSLYTKDKSPSPFRKIISDSNPLHTTRNDRVKFRWRIKNGKPKDFFLPQRKDNWFWPLHGFTAGKKLYIFLNEIEKTADQDVFGFRSCGNYMAEITNYHLDPILWKIRYHRLPFFDEDKKALLTYGNGVLKRENSVFVYGLYQADKHNNKDKKLVVTEVPIKNIKRFNRWKTNLTPLKITEPTVEFTLHNLSNGKILFTHCRNEISRQIWCAVADSPYGPFETYPVATIDNGKHKQRFAYAGKAHPIPGTKDEFVLSHVINTFSWEDLLNHAEIYRPRFYRFAPLNR
jgi:hypothetical protein